MANERNLRPRQPDYLGELHDKQGYKLALLGCGIKQIAWFLGFSQSTIYRWFAAYPSFKAAVDRGRVYADAQVAEALYRLATGYEYDEEVLLVIRTGPHQQQVVRVVVRRHLPPDPKAALFWLVNRQPHLWSKNPQPSIGRDVSITLNLDGESMSPPNLELAEAW